MYKIAFERLPDHIRKSNNEKLYDIAYGSISDLRDTLYAIGESRDIDKTTGYTLDLIGGNVGQERPPGMPDDEYRLIIKIKIVANLSKGDIPTINKVAESLFGKAYVGVNELWDATSVDKEIAAIMLHLRPPFSRFPQQTLDKVAAGGVRVFWSVVYEQNTDSLFIGAYNLSGEEITVLPSPTRDIEANPYIYISVAYEGIAENVTLQSTDYDNSVDMKLGVDSLGNLINQLEQVVIHSNKGGGIDV